VRFLPPHDPYLQQRDRATLLPSRTLHHRVLRAAGGPGVVLADGDLVATWRARKQRTTLLVDVEPFEALSAAIRAAIGDEAQLLAPYRGCERAETRFVT
jgi:hypothetical protein